MIHGIKLKIKKKRAGLKLEEAKGKKGRIDKIKRLTKSIKNYKAKIRTLKKSKRRYKK